MGRTEGDKKDEYGNRARARKDEISRVLDAYLTAFHLG